MNQKGKVVADANVLKLSETEWVIASVSSASATVRKRLEDYVIADDVALVDETNAMRALAVWGDDVAGILAAAVGHVPATGQFHRSGELFFFAGRRIKAANFEFIGPEKAVEELRGKLAAAGAREAQPGELEFLRINDGIPTIPRDIGPGDLPNEGALEDDAISFTKGCYLGQEVMARLKNLGQVRRRLFVLRGRGALPAAGTAVFQGERKFGEIRSTAAKDDDWIAMAMLSLTGLDRAVGLSLTPGAAASVHFAP